MTEEGYILPEEKYLKPMFFRKPGLPILMIELPDGTKVPYWNTFYQQTDYDENGNLHYKGQMDLNVKSPLVWQYYKDVLKKLAEYGAAIVRLDAFAYAPKELGKKNFLNEPETWKLLQDIQKMADDYNLTLLPEIHASYEEKIYEKLAQKGYMTYDFFLPGLILDAFEQRSGKELARWANEIIGKKIQTVNMLGCHDGIPLLDLKGMLSDERIDKLIQTVVNRGGYVKNLHGQKNMYYQVNATYYSALGEDDRKLLLARAIQLFMPGKPQIWYLDLFAGKNDYDAVKRAGKDGHKEINRTNLSREEVLKRLKTDLVQKQIEMIRMRNTFPAFSERALLNVAANGENIIMQWTYKEYVAKLEANLKEYSYRINCFCDGKEIEY